MKKQVSRKKVIEKKLMPQVLRILEAQGRESLEQARKRLSAIRVENVEAREGLKLYAKIWSDTIHPALLSLSCDAVSSNPFDVADLQVAVLLLTAAMDIHDDVLDKSKTKGSNPTIYGRFGEDLAILIGDALLLEGFMMMHSLRRSMDVESSDRIMEIVNNCLLEVGNAHLMELELKRKIRVAPDEILRLIEKKAAIFEGICEIGAIAGNGSEGQIKVLKAVGRAFGYLVMLREEFIDMFESAELSSRLKNEYPPLPILYAIENHKVKKTVASLRRSRRITEDATQELVSVVYEDRNVIKLKETMTVKAMQTIELLNAYVMKKEPASKLALLLRGTLEDLK
jgi:geranylgeranyl pyrophosphate synthase